MTVRPPRPDDAAEWLRMRLALWPDDTPDEHRADMTEYLASGHLAAFVAERPGGGLVGFAEAGLRGYAEGCDTSPVGYLEGWYVDPDARRTGVGGKLVAAAEQWAAGRGCGEFASDCPLDNTTSLAAHLALGFEEVERQICFRKPLGPVGG